MISDKLVDKITPHLKRCLNKDMYREIDYMFEECYVTEEEGFTMITLRPPWSTQIGGFQFYELTGAFKTIVPWEDVKRKGRRM